MVSAMDAELRLANLLMRIDESSDGSLASDDAAITDELQLLSLEQIQQLRDAKGCLLFLDQVRELEEGATLKNQNGVTLDFRDRAGELPYSSKVPSQIGRYQVQELIGQGGFARVFRATDPELERDVALKIPRVDSLLLPGARLRFQREAKAAATLSHPAIVPIFEAGSCGDLDYIAFAFCDGETLASLLERETKIVPRAAASVVSTLAEALGHAHQRGVIHRDIKPGNILVDSQVFDPQDIGTLAGSLRITDFGLVKLNNGPATDEQDLTCDGAIVGTPAYMSPEQARGENQIGGESDIFSLGTILYQLLTGQLPHKKARHLDTLNSIASEEAVPLRNLDRKIPKDLEAICLKCIRKDVKDRYETAFDLQLDLERWLSGRIVQARRATGLERLVRWCRRNPVIAGAIFFAIGSLGTGASVATKKWLEADRERAAAVAARQSADKEAKRSANLLNSFVETFRQFRLAPQSRELTAEQMLALTRNNVSQQLADDPMAQVEMFQILANCFQGIGEVNQQVHCLELALKVLERIHSDDFSELLPLRTKLMVAYRSLDDFEQSLKFQKETVARCEKEFGPFSNITIKQKVSKAVATHIAGGAQDAQRQLWEILEATESGAVQFHSDSPSEIWLRVFAANRLAFVLLEARELQQVVTLYRDRIEKFVSEMPPLDRNLQSAWQNLAKAYSNLNKHSRAIEIQRNVIANRLKNGSTAIEARKALLPILGRSKNYAEAAEVANEIVQELLEEYGPDHPKTLRAQKSYAVRLRNANGIPLAIEHQKQVIERSRAELGKSNHLTIETMLDLAKCYRLSGQYETALQLAKQAEEDLGLPLDSAIELAEDVARDVGRSLAAAGRMKEYENYMQKLIDLRVTKYGNENLVPNVSRIEYAMQKLRQRDYVEAEELVRKFMQSVPRSKEVEHFFQSANTFLAYALIGQGKHSKAMEAMDSIRQRSFRLKAVGQSVLGECLLVEGRYAAAEELLLKSQKTIESKWLNSSPEDYASSFVRPHTRFLALDATQRLVDLYRATKDQDKVQRWEKKLEEIRKQVPPMVEE